ncbi:MAG: alpha-2-macroglobulin family protein, partial [Bacteroides sp.]
KMKPTKQVALAYDSAQKTEDAAPVTIRKNFEETAFFYPQLRTNEQGQIAFSFTMPQSLTSWQFYGLATTKEMMSGKLEAIATTSKEFMLVPNMPRFVRVGDKSTIAASIINLSKEQVNGEASMELFNPETEEVIYTQSQKFAVKADSTIAVNFAFTANESSSLLACRIIAKANRFSDGEQRLLPVLTNKEWITESVPMTIRGAETRKFSLKGLFNHQSATATNRRLTVEFASNPAWYAVQALPTLSNPVSDNAISWAAAYYANSLASYIVNSQPRLKTVFDTWKSQNATKETLWSNLQKNEELKNILLQETPWVMEATTEAEQKQRLSLLFDLNTIQNNNAMALDKLGKLQNSNGSWSWCIGMNGSEYTTSFVLESLCKLAVITGKPLSADALTMQKKAFDYLHAQVAEDYKAEQKLKEKATTINGSTLTYLYLCSLTPDIIPEGNRKAFLYYIEKLPRVIRSLTLREKALAAIILEKATKKAEATDFINSIKEYALTSDEMTRYRISTQVNVLEALQQAGNNEQAVEDIKLWLLKEKRTQTWESPIATVNAVYALLTNGNDLLANNEQAKITLGKQKIPLTADYTKETFSGKNLKPNMTNITVEKRSKGIAWGAVYAQYLEEMSKVSKDSSQALSINKQMYVERTVDNQTTRTPIKDLRYLQIGDKLLVRLILTIGRNMDFVQLKDERAACLEPLNSLSGYQFGSNVGYYQSVEDASTIYFFDELRKGTYLLESSFYVSREGQYASGIATLQSAYAPEFIAHTTSTELVVK